MSLFVRTTVVIIRIMALSTVMALSACASTREYYGAPIEAWVVDAESGKPVEGVAVMAVWKYKWGTIGGTAGEGSLVVMEAVTDSNGRFAFPAWGPERLPPAKGVWFGAEAYLDTWTDPALYLLKPGYRYLRLGNYPHEQAIDNPMRKSAWNGKTVRMERAPKTDADHARQIYSLNNEVARAVEGMPTNQRECEWRKIPRMIKALHEERKRLEQLGAWTVHYRSIDQSLLANEKQQLAKGCGSVHLFLRGALR